MRWGVVLLAAVVLSGCDSGYSLVKEGERQLSSCVIMDAGGREAACSCFVEDGVVRCNVCRPAGATRRVFSLCTTDAACLGEQRRGRVGSRSMPIEFLHGRPLEPEELEMIRQQIEHGFDTVDVIDPEIRAIVARNWPHLLAKLPPEENL